MPGLGWALGYRDAKGTSMHHHPLGVSKQQAPWAGVP